MALYTIYHRFNIIFGSKLLCIYNNTMQVVDNYLNLTWGRDPGESRKRKATSLFCCLQPINSSKNTFNCFAHFCECWLFFNESCDNAFNKSNLSVFKTLEAPAIKFEA